MFIHRAREVVVYVFVLVCGCMCVYVHVWILVSFLGWITLHLTFFETGLLIDLTKLVGQQAPRILYLPPRRKS